MPSGRAELATGAAGPIPELRHVAVLFADLQGFTRLCERLDPEEVVDILQAIFERLGEEVIRYGGHVDKVLGDGVMALFGAPQAHEDDCLRAVMAGLAMQQAMSALQPWIRERLDQSIGLRVGIDAGPVVYGAVGPGPSAPPTVIGDAANVAARLQRVASPGQVVVSARVQRLTAPHVQTRRLGIVQLEGRQAAVSAHLAVAPYSPLPQAPSGPGAMLLGRDVELERLSADYEAAAHSGPMVVFVAGERGIGKTRLLAEFAARLGVLAASERPLVIQVRNRWEVGAVYRPCERLVEALGWRARYQWNGAARPRGAASYLLTGGEDGAAQAVSALAQVCDRMSVVLLIDDWDWADPDEGPSLVRLVAGSKGLPVMFVVAGRKVEPSLFGLDPEIAVRHLRLQPLTESQSCQLVQQHPASSALPPDAIEALVRRGGGNPAHLLESIEALIDEGTLTASGDGWVVREGQALDAVPESLRNGVLSRLDTLPPAAKELVRLCAVLGENLAPRVLAELAGQSVEDVGRAMEAVVEAGLMWPEESEGGYRFRSPLVREVAYDTMLRRHRAELHRRVGLYLEAAGTADVEALALHSVKGGLAEQAARYGPAAGERLLHWGRPQEAAALLSELESLMGDYPPEERARVQELLAQAYVSQGACQAGLERLLDALGSVRDPAWRARLMREVGWAHAIDGRPDLAMRHYQQARELAASTANEGEWAMVAASMRLLYDRP